MRFPGFIQVSTTDIRETLYRGEQIRVLTVSGSALVAAIAAFIRISVSARGFGEGDFPIVATAFLLGFVVYELFSLYLLKRRLARGRSQSFIKSWFDTTLEGILPFGMGVVAILDTFANPYVVASGPLVMAALLLVTLSVLRLNPWMSLMCGASATISYVLMVVWIHAEYPIQDFSDYNYPRSFFPIAVSLLAVGTALAVVISGQSRVWLQTAWTAAENIRERRESERDLQLASDTQQALFPRDWPDGGVFDLAASSRPAAKLGGDFYDWMPVSKDRIVLCLADVTGHGVASALMGAEGRAYMRASIPQSKDLVELTNRIEELLGYDLRGGRFITMLLVLLDTEDGSLKVYSAGQGPIFILRESGTIDEIEVHRPPLGIPWNGDEQPTEVNFGVGDILVAVSDGVLDRLDPSGRDLGVEGFRTMLETVDRSTARALVDDIFRHTDAFAEGIPALDDSSVVVVRRTG